MKLDRKLYGWGIGAVWTLTWAALAYANDISINSLRHYFTSSPIAAEPGVMVMIGVGLIALRVLVARRSKPRDKDPAHS